jgi:hypothetical protein
MTKQQELERLYGTGQNEVGNNLISELVVTCDGNAPEVLNKIKDVLKTIIGSELTVYDSIDDWKAILPEWLVASFSSEITKEEAKEILSKPNGQALLADRWTINGFLFWFRPEERNWFWWDAKVKDSNTLSIQVLVYGFPFAWGALRWLLNVAGASHVTEN